MAFCSNCGHQLAGNEKFCAECGTLTQGATTPAAASAPSPLPPAPPVPSMAAAPAMYPSGAVPVAVPMPPSVQPAQQKKGMLGTVVVIILVAGIGYYFYNKSHTPATRATPAPAPAPAPAPVVQNPPPANGNQNGGGDAALVNLQAFNANWQDTSGMLMLTTATWANNSNTDITSATLQCRQYNSAGTDLSEYRVALNGPTKAQTSSQFSNIALGATATGMAKVDCSIIHVKP
jgi:hypothetical protein